MEAIQATTREAQERWMEIEALCGFPILYVNGKNEQPYLMGTIHLHAVQNIKMS